LAVAHFGRGRGAWQDEAQPKQWREVVERVAEAEVSAVEGLWKLGVEKEAMPEVVVRDAHRLVKRLTLAALDQLYPERG
jgi:hypothetical protein